MVSLGHTAIAHLAGPQSPDTAVRRKRGFRQAMTAARLPVPRGYVVEADYTNTGGLAAMAKLLAHAEPPTAVVVANVASAIGAVRAAHLAGVSIPRQLSIVAVHDLSLVEYLDPPLTTVHMPVQELGYRGIELLTSVAADAKVHEVISELPDRTTKPTASSV